MKSKLIFGLAAMALVLTLATSSFAQIRVIINNSAPSPGEIRTNRNAATSDTSAVGNGILVSGSILAASQLTTTFLLLTFPAPVTSSLTIPTGDPIRITGQTGIFASAAVSTINYSTGVVTLTLPGQDNTAGASGSFRLVGTRIDANGKTAPLTGTAALSSGANNYILDNSTFSLIAALGAGIGGASIGAVPTLTSAGTTLMFTNQIGGVPADPFGSFTVSEGFVSAWKTPVQASTSGVALLNGHNVRITIDGIPAGVTVTLTPVYPASPSATFVQGAQAFDSSGSGTNQKTWTFATTDTTAAETVQFNVTVGGAPTGTLTAGSITAVITMAPVGNALTSAGVPAESGTNLGGYPRFAAENTTLTIGTIAAANTTMLVPYFAKGFGLYDFGVAVANTNADPFDVSAGGATEVGGAIRFTIYIRGVATPVTLSTTTLTSSQAAGIVSGQIPAGGVFTGALSQMLPSSAPADAVGYIFIEADFLNAHGIAYLIENNRITSAAPVLVLPPPNSTPRNGPVEILAF